MGCVAFGGLEPPKAYGCGHEAGGLRPPCRGVGLALAMMLGIGLVM